MTQLTVSHVAIGVADVDRAARFYSHVLGLEVSLDRIEEGEPLGARRRAAYLRPTGETTGTYLVLDQLLEGRRERPPARLFDFGYHHVAFEVGNLAEVVERLRELGHRVSEPAVIDSLWTGIAHGRDVRTALTRDPDGNLLQFDEYVPQPLP